MNIPHYPLVFELDCGERITVTRNLDDEIIKRTIKLISVTPSFSPEFWTSNNGDKRNLYSSAEITIEVDGKEETLIHRPYQSPFVIQGLRIYVENIKEWAENAEYAVLKDLKKQVRFSICAEKESWGPTSITFPIKNFRWNSSSYNNTWSSLVPYNLLYYHRGEDFGAIPDRFQVISPVSGKIIASPLPDGDGASNSLIIQDTTGIEFKFGHMNIESVNPECISGSFIKAGTKLGKTGMTWAGRKSQKYDPHLHIDISYKGMKLASFPFLIEAYMRMYHDSVIALAGGYEYTIPNKKIILDGNRSTVKPGEKISSYTWKLHNGKEVKQSKIKIEYKKPGLYTEMLIVKTENGAIDYDFLQVRVWNPEYGKDIASGWCYQYPVRNVKVNTDVLFWNRLRNTQAPVLIDFGDGNISEIDTEIKHSYKKPGHYIVTFSSYGPRDEPIINKLDVIVQD